MWIEVIEPLANFFQWKIIAKGGNNNPGRIGGLGNCPCQSEYTYVANQVIINAWPKSPRSRGLRGQPTRSGEGLVEMPR